MLCSGCFHIHFIASSRNFICSLLLQLHYIVVCVRVCACACVCVFAAKVFVMLGVHLSQAHWWGSKKIFFFLNKWVSFVLREADKQLSKQRFCCSPGWVGEAELDQHIHSLWLHFLSWEFLGNAGWIFVVVANKDKVVIAWGLWPWGSLPGWMLGTAPDIWAANGSPATFGSSD